MSCFTTMSAVTAGGELDLTKHVNYTAGMILGVDDFTQEFAYLSGRDRWLARDTIGYGTVSGLSVRIEEDAEKGFRVMVLPGVAINPRGQLICVPAAQCAYLNQWLADAKPEELKKWVKTESTSPPITSPPAGDRLTLYVVLCYRDCPTDDVPIPGEPCRNEDELTAPSRIKDDFSLELSFEPPEQSEEDSVRKYVRWLRQIEITETDISTSPEDFRQAIRDSWLPVTSPPTSPPVTSPPAFLRINKDDVCEYMRIAFRLWVTELRERLSGRETGCGVEMTGGGKLGKCVLLAQLDIPLVAVSPGWRVSDTVDIEINEENRPFLLHLRMLQEWLLCGCTCPVEASPPVTSPPVTSPPFTSPPEVTSPPVTSPPTVVHDHSLDSLSDVSVPAPTEGQVLVFNGSEWVAKDFEGTGGGTSDHGALTGLNDDDHKQYLLTNGKRALTGNLQGGSKRIINLAPGQANGEAVVFEQAIKQGDAAGGDLDSNYPNPVIGRLQGKPVKADSPNKGDTLIWDGTVWTTQKITSPPPPTAEPFLILPLATVTRQGVNAFELWFNIDAPGNMAEIKTVSRENLRIFDETVDSNSPRPFLNEIGYNVKPVNRNVFEVSLRVERNQPEPDFMRFDFNIDKTIVSFKNDELPLADYAGKNNIKIAGYLKGETATVFVRGSGAKLG